MYILCMPIRIGWCEKGPHVFSQKCRCWNYIGFDGVTCMSMLKNLKLNHVQPSYVKYLQVNFIHIFSPFHHTSICYLLSWNLGVHIFTTVYCVDKVKEKKIFQSWWELRVLYLPLSEGNSRFALVSTWHIWYGYQSTQSKPHNHSITSPLVINHGLPSWPCYT